MPPKNFARALKELEIYCEKRDLPNLLPTCETNFENFANIPGLFDQDVILKELKILESIYPKLIPELLPSLKTILSTNQFASLESYYSKWESSKIESLDEWEDIEATIGTYCEQILPFLAKTFRPELPSTSLMKIEKLGIELNCDCKSLRVNASSNEYFQCATVSKTNAFLGSTTGIIYKIPLEFEVTNEEGIKTFEAINLQRSKWQLHKWPIQDIVDTNLDNLLISCDSTGGICLWDADEFKRLSKYDVRNGSVWQLAVPPTSNQQMFASAHEDGTARLFYYDRSDCLRLFVHSASVSHVAFYGRLIATTTFDERNIRVWNIDVGNQVRLIDGLDSAILGIAFLDENYIASISTLGTIDFSELSTSKVVASQAIEFQQNEKCSFLTRLSEKTVTVGGSLGSLFFVTLNFDYTLEFVKKLPAENSLLQFPLLAADWNTYLNNFYAIFA